MLWNVLFKSTVLCFHDDFNISFNVWESFHIIELQGKRLTIVCQNKTPLYNITFSPKKMTLVVERCWLFMLRVRNSMTCFKTAPAFIFETYQPLLSLIVSFIILIHACKIRPAPQSLSLMLVSGIDVGEIAGSKLWLQWTVNLKFKTDKYSHEHCKKR